MSLSISEERTFVIDYNDATSLEIRMSLRSYFQSFTVLTQDLIIILFSPICTQLFFRLP